MEDDLLNNQKQLPTDTQELHSIVLGFISKQQIWEQTEELLEQEKKLLSKDLAKETKYRLKLEQETYVLKGVIEELKLQLAILKSKQFGYSSEKRKQEISELEGRIEEHEISLGLQEIDSNITKPSPKEKNKAKRQKLPDNLQREEVLVEGPEKCPSCEGDEFRKLGEDISEVLEYVPASFKVIRYVRQRLVCQDCQEIVQSERVDKTIDKGKAGPGLLAHVIVQKYGYHLPLYRQSQMYASSGIDISRSTMADWVGSCALLLSPLVLLIQKHVLSNTQIHGDDTPVKVLAPELGKTKRGRLWCYVVDGRPHGSDFPPAVCYFYSPNRNGEHPLSHLKDYRGVLHADAYSGYNKLYDDDKNNGEVTESGCWAHTRRKFYEITLRGKAVIAEEVIYRLGKIYEIEKEIKGLDPGKRLEVRQKHSQKLIDELFERFKEVKNKLPPKSGTTKAINYALNQEKALRHFLQDGKLEIDNNAAERALRGIAVGRKNWLFAGSDQGGETAANIYTLLESAKLNGIDPWQYLSQVLSVIQEYNSQKLEDLLPWNIVLQNLSNK
jgi:transposase